MEQLAEVKPRPQYSRDPHKFIAARSGGGGFCFFEPTQDFHSLSWLRKFARCVHCGGGISYRKHSHIPADGLISNAYYPVCDRDGHAIRHSSDITWTVADQAREEAWRAKGKVDDVRAAYDWLTAKTKEEIQDEGIPV